MENATEILSIKNKVFKIVGSQLCINITNDYIHKDLINELGLDSIAVIHIITMVEKLYHIPISDEECERLRTINNIIEFIEDNLYQKKYLIKKCYNNN